MLSLTSSSSEDDSSSDDSTAAAATGASSSSEDSSSLLLASAALAGVAVSYKHPAMSRTACEAIESKSCTTMKCKPLQ